MTLLSHVPVPPLVPAPPAGPASPRHDVISLRLLYEVKKKGGKTRLAKQN